MLPDSTTHVIAMTERNGKGKQGRLPKLTPSQANQLRERAAAGENKSALAREFEISRQSLYAYIRNTAKAAG